MHLQSWLPSRLRVRLRATRAQLRALLAAGGPGVPTAHEPHAAEEIAALTERARQEQQHRRDRAAEAGESLRAEFRDLTLREVVRETGDARTLVFDRRVEPPLGFHPGQYLTLLPEIDGEVVHRDYSISSDPGDPEHVAVTVKRLPGGRVSGWLHEHLRPGDVIRTLGPGGRFGIEPQESVARPVVLVGAGSGITPLMSVLRLLARTAPGTPVDLIYGNRRLKDVIFRRELGRLSRATESWTVVHVLTRPGTRWRGPRGRLEGEVLRRVLPVRPDALYLVCGPEGMMQAVGDHLRGAGVAADAIRTELFTPPAARQLRSATGAVHSVRFARSGVMLQVPDHQPLLEAALAAGLPLPSSCAMGGCAACKVRVIEGEIDLEEPNCLTEQERAAGERLICVGYPRGALVLDA